MAGVACSQMIHIYSTAGELLDKVNCMETISSIYFGQYGRETNSLAIITAGKFFMSIYSVMEMLRSYFDKFPRRKSTFEDFEKKRRFYSSVGIGS